MKKSQQQHIRKQAAVRTKPAPPVKRTETTPEQEQAAREKRRQETLEKIEARRARTGPKAPAGAKDTQPAGKAANGGKPKE